MWLLMSVYVRVVSRDGAGEQGLCLYRVFAGLVGKAITVSLQKV